MDENFDMNRPRDKENNVNNADDSANGNGTVRKEEFSNVIHLDRGTDFNNESEDKGKNEERVEMKRYTIDDRGKLRQGNTAAAELPRYRTWLILGWVCAAFTAFIRPWFAIPGIFFGILVNNQAKGRGNAVIITNVVLAVAYYILLAVLRSIFGY